MLCPFALIFLELFHLLFLKLADSIFKQLNLQILLHDSLSLAFFNVTIFILSCCERHAYLLITISRLIIDWCYARVNLLDSLFIFAFFFSKSFSNLSQLLLGGLAWLFIFICCSQIRFTFVFLILLILNFLHHIPLRRREAKSGATTLSIGAAGCKSASCRWTLRNKRGGHHHGTATPAST